MLAAERGEVVEAVLVPALGVGPVVHLQLFAGIARPAAVSVAFQAGLPELTPRT